jgi:hypothetical protein
MRSRGSIHRCQGCDLVQSYEVGRILGHPVVLANEVSILTFHDLTGSVASEVFRIGLVRGESEMRQINAGAGWGQDPCLR